MGQEGERADDSEEAHGPGEGRERGNDGSEEPKKAYVWYWKEGTEVSWPYVWTECYLRKVTLARRAEAWEGRGDDQ